MSISVTFNFATLTELAAAVAKLSGTGIVGPIVAQTADAAPKPKAEKSANQVVLEKLKAGAAEPAASAPTPEPSPPPAAAAKTPAVDYPTLQKSVFELAGLVQKKGLDSTEYVLSIAVALGSPNFKGLPADKWGSALQAVKDQIVAVAALEVEVA